MARYRRLEMSEEYMSVDEILGIFNPPSPVDVVGWIAELIAEINANETLGHHVKFSITGKYAFYVVMCDTAYNLTDINPETIASKILHQSESVLIADTKELLAIHNKLKEFAQ